MYRDGDGGSGSTPLDLSELLEGTPLETRVPYIDLGDVTSSLSTSAGNRLLRSSATATPTAATVKTPTATTAVVTNALLNGPDSESHACNSSVSSAVQHSTAVQVHSQVLPLLVPPTASLPLSMSGWGVDPSDRLGAGVAELVALNSRDGDGVLDTDVEADGEAVTGLGPHPD